MMFTLERLGHLDRGHPVVLFDARLGRRVLGGREDELGRGRGADEPAGLAGRDQGEGGGAVRLAARDCAGPT